MNYFSLKNLTALLIVLCVVTLSLGISSSLGQNSQTFDFFPKYKDIYSDNLQVNSVNLTQGDSLDTSFTVYNMSDKEKGVSTGVFLVNSNKKYDGSVVDYASQKQEAIIKSKDTKNFSWKIPANLDQGNYKMLYWVHQMIDGAETVLEDNWYQREIQISPNPSLNTIKGEESSKDQGFVIHDLLISPKRLQIGKKLSLSYRIVNNESDTGKMVSGVFLLEKNKKYTGADLDQVLPSQKATIQSGGSSLFQYDETINMKPGEYRILIWLHRINQSKEETVFDYWAPGNIIVEN